MTPPESRDRPRGDGRDAQRCLVAAVRAASAPAPAMGAARRIADGAWARAGGAQDGRTGRTARRSVVAALSRRRRGHVARRFAVAAAALLAVGLGAFALRPTEPVFAVEGEPVKVWKDDGWQETRRVRLGATVFVAGGVEALRGRGALTGEVIFPDPGTTLRIVGDAGGTGTLTVRILGGAAEVRGDVLRLSLADVDVAPRRADATFGVWGCLPVTVSVGASPRGVQEAARTAVARVGIRLGDAVVRRRSTGERLELAGEEMAALLPVERDGRTVYRLGRLRRFEPSFGIRIAAGHPVLDVRATRGGVIAVLGGPGDVVSGVAIDDSELPAALDQIRTAMLAFVTVTGSATGSGAGSGSDANGNGMRIAVVAELTRGDEPDLEARAEADGETLTEISVSRDGAVIRVVVSSDGGVEIERDGEREAYPSLAAARDADAAALALVEPYLGR